jgi:CheY-like chemotaxis protein
MEVGTTVCLRVRDDGTGMDDTTRARIFEPFFTTKEIGRGTGLGLSTVFGIVRSSRGSISVESGPGSGSTFTVLLPETTEAPPKESVPTGAKPGPASARRVLVVDDEPVVRKIVVHVLRRAGYDVLDADGPAAALAVLAGSTVGIDLLVTDMLLGGESGRTLANEVRLRFPDVPVLYMSGYPDGALEPEKALRPGDPFIHKPFTPDAIVSAVERALARSAATR